MNVTWTLLFVAAILLALLGVLIEMARLLFLFLAVRGIAQGRLRSHRESIRTSIFSLLGWGVAGTAAVVLLQANQVETPDVSDRQGKPLFEDFEPIDVKRLEIVKYDADTNQFDEFRVEQRGSGRSTGLWRIPSHQNYPADAIEQVQAAANSLINLEVIGVVPEEQIDNELMGVVQPDRQTVEVGQEGVGIEVALRDKNNRDLANLIIGKPLKDKPQQRFVRIPDQVPVYVVQYDVGVLKTDFREWIQRDLLQLEEIDIAQVRIKDYQVDPDLFLREGKIDVTRNYDLIAKANFSVWELEKLVFYRNQATPEEVELGVNEELNGLRLDELRTALDDLEIIDVERKPEGLGADLTAGTDFLKQAGKNEELLSLASHGFIPQQQGEQVDLLSSNGELVVLTKDGIEYVLRFGRILTGNRASTASGELNRFLMVTTRVNEDAFPLPIKQSPSSSSDVPPPGGNVPPPPPGGGGSETADDTSSSQEQAASSQEQAASSQEQAAKQRQAEREYQRQMEEREKRLKEARLRVRELNARFADWYYVVPEEAYNKLRLPANKVIVRQP